MRVLVDICHPAQVHLFRPVLEAWQRSGYEYLVAARDKDITFKLLDIYGISYTMLVPSGIGALGYLREFLQREVAMFRLARKFRPAVITGTSPNAARVSKVLGIKSVILCEDDAKYIPQFRWLAYPMASAIVMPDCLEGEDYGVRHLTYPSYQKLFYLHPARFSPDRSVIRELGIDEGAPYALIRLSSLQAYHDVGARGMSEELIRRVIKLSENEMRVFISSEKPLSPEFERFRLPIPVERVHHALAFAEFFLGDSQSMTVESALLGTPAFKINTFAGIISVIKDLQNYGLVYDYRPGQENTLIETLQRMLAMKDRRDHFKRCQSRMLSKKIDPLPWYRSVIQKFLEGASVKEVKRWSTDALGSGEFASAIDGDVG